MKSKIHNRTYLKQFRRDLRSNAAKSENYLWKALRRSQVEGKKFRRQHSIENFIVDFYCASEKLIIEVDGSIHDNFINADYDNERTKRLNELGFKVIRFSNKEVKENIDLVIEAIKDNFEK